jgi:hypothetical protein
MTIRPIVNAYIITLVPLVYSLSIRAVLGVELLNLIQWSDILTILLQFAIVFLVFYRLNNDDSATTWIILGASGLITTAFVIPAFVLVIT